MRKLLHYRGIDDSVATYTTDYIVGIMAILYAVVVTALAYKIKRWNSFNLQSIRGKINNQEAFYFCSRMLALSMVLYSCSVMLIAGGIVHQVVKTIPHSISSYPNEDIRIHKREMMPLFILWQVACFSGTTMALFLIAYSINLLTSHFNRSMILSNDNVETNNRNIFTSKYNKYFVTTMLIVMTVGQIAWRFFSVHEYIKTANSDVYMSEEQINTLQEEVEIYKSNQLLSIWTMDISSFLLLTAILIFITVSLFLLCKERLMDDSVSTFASDNRSDDIESQGTKEDVNDSKFKLIPPLASKNTIAVSAHCLNYLRFVASMIIFASGAIQYSLGLYCYGDDYSSCPLPRTFNHNALFHIILGFGLTILFIAEILQYLIFRRKLMTKFPQIT